MVQYRLLYGDGRGLAEPARMLFNYAKVEFEDDRSTTLANIDQIRHELPFGQVPVLIIDNNVRIAQSKAIFRFLGRKFGLAGKDEVEEALVDSYGDFLADLITNTTNEVSAEDAQSYIENKWENYLDKIVEASGTGFVAKSGVTWVDFLMANFYENSVKSGKDYIANIKNLKVIHDNVNNLPQLKEYFSNRKETQY
ncbi:unnamed protein product [Bursaphelenchus okinawaensis]|uniref:Glutathione S-transferase n=1 Tax=Bursaphelenchus okinawaensis TaxID=465554 RepID=A0A811KML9_9BILA|nr:unnamed protein product [Bursaphelenchus okinawaensis]CAG9105687.1 unnamed protein product [Bursaphelenchus okinawaensis]